MPQQLAVQASNERCKRGIVCKLERKLSSLNQHSCAIARHRHGVLPAQTVHGLAVLNMMAADKVFPTANRLKPTPNTRLHRDAITGISPGLS